LSEKEDGAVLIAGTGSIAFIKNQGKQQRVGGLGWYLGDEGSGFFMGKKAIAATIAEEKGFGEKTALTFALKAHFQQKEMVHLIPYLQNGTISSAQVAAVSPIVFNCAYSKRDPIARHIVTLAARKLANLVCCGLEMTQKGKTITLNPDWPIYLIGGQFKDPYAQQWIKEFLSFLPQNEKFTLHNLAHLNITTVVVQQKLASAVSKSFR